MNKIAIASIKGQDGGKITFLCDAETFEVTADNGEEVSYGDTPESAAEAFEVISSQWGVNTTDVWELEWLAGYNEITNEIEPV